MPTFVPPTVDDLPWVNNESPPLARRLLRYYGPTARGRSVLRIAGTYRTVDSPDQLTLATATETYLGGHRYEVSEETATLLYNAGYVTELGGWAPGPNTLYLPGTAGNYASTPDTAANSPTSQVDVRIRVAATNWAAAGDQGLVSKYNTAGGRTWLWVIRGGKMIFWGSGDGTNLGIGGFSSSSFTGLVTNGEPYWLRATVNTATSTLTYYASADGSTWTQLSVHTGSGWGNFYDSASAVTVGDQPSVGVPLTGNIYVAEIRTAIGGSLINTFDATAVTKVGTRNPSSVVASTGETWTLNGSAWDWENA